VCGVCACVREVCVVVLEQILQLYPVERQSKKKKIYAQVWSLKGSEYAFLLARKLLVVSDNLYV